jgi:hypothetical protein
MHCNSNISMHKERLERTLLHVASIKIELFNVKCRQKGNLRRTEFLGQGVCAIPFELRRVRGLTFKRFFAKQL